MLNGTFCFLDFTKTGYLVGEVFLFLKFTSCNDNGDYKEANAFNSPRGPMKISLNFKLYFSSLSELCSTLRWERLMRVFYENYIIVGYHCCGYSLWLLKFHRKFRVRKNTVRHGKFRSKM
jgi:hypothetical protein